jgi:hypothetical protein
MKRKWAGSLIVTLGLAAGGARADQGSIPMPGAPSAPAVKVAADTPAPGAPAPAPVVIPPGTAPTYAPGDHGACAIDDCHKDSGIGVYGTVEYLLWWLRTQTVPPLVISGNATSAPVVLGQPGTVTLFGGNTGTTDGLSGGRVTAGANVGGIGIEGSYFQLETASKGFIATENGATANSTTITLPFLNTNTGQQNSLLIASPNGQPGTVTAAVRDRFWGAEANARLGLYDEGGIRLAALAGFRFVSLTESIGLDAVSGPVGGVSYANFSNWGTRNEFYGGQLGIDATVCKGSVFAEACGKIALGSNQETVDINGSSSLTAAGTTITSNTSLLTGPNNTGHFTHSDFTWLPEFTFRVGYKISHAVDVSIGYNFLYIGDVVRPGKEIDTSSPGFFAPPAAHPSFPGFPSSDFWAQGINFAVGVHF